MFQTSIRLKSEPTKRAAGGEREQPGFRHSLWQADACLSCGRVKENHVSGVPPARHLVEDILERRFGEKRIFEVAHEHAVCPWSARPGDLPCPTARGECDAT